MKKIKIFKIPIFFAILYLLYFIYPKTVFSIENYNLNNEGLNKNIKLIRQANKQYLILEYNNQTLLKHDLSNLNIKDMQITELDKDGLSDIFLSVKKSTLLHREIIERPFFLNIKDNKLIRKWTGSTLGYPYKKVEFKDIDNDGRNEVIAVSNIKGTTKTLIYRWMNFGFQLCGEYNEN